MDRYILDGQYGKYLEMIGIRIGEALKAAFLSQLAVRWTALLQAPLYAFLCRIMLRIYNKHFAAPVKPASPKE